MAKRNGRGNEGGKSSDKGKSKSEHGHHNDDHRHFDDHSDHDRGRGHEGSHKKHGMSSATKINGGDGNDFIIGSDAVERINAGDGDDTIFAGAGDDTVYGNDGWDTLVLSGSLRDMTLTEGKGNSYVLTTAEGGTDKIKHIEVLQFDDFTYQVGVNNGVFTSADAASVDEDGTVTVDVLANDFDAEGDAFGITAFDGISANGATVSLINDRLVYDASSVAAYQALAAGESATDSFSYTVTDAAGYSSTGTVSVTINGTNDAPVITGGDTSGSVSEDDTLSVSGTMTATDVDATDTLTWSVANGAGAYGTLSMNADGNWTYTLDNDSDSVQALEEGQVETESFTVSVTDGTEVRSQTISITVNGAGDGIPATPTDFFYADHFGGWWGSAPINWEGSEGSDYLWADAYYAFYHSTFDGGDSDDLMFLRNRQGHMGLNQFDGGDGNDILDIHSNGISNNVIGGGNGDDQILINQSIWNIANATVNVNGNTVSGGTGDDVISVKVHQGQNDTLAIFDNTFDGGEGNDTLIIDGNSGDYTLTLNDDGTITMTSPYGDNTLSGIETVVFNDATIATADITPPGVFTDLGVNPEDTPIVENWIPGGTNGYWTNISTFTSEDDVHTLNVNNTIYSWLDDNFMGNRQTGYDFYEGDDVFAVRLGANGGQGQWSRSGVDMGDGNDIFAMDIDSSNSGGIDGWHNAAEFVGGAGDDEFRFDIDTANYAWLTGQKMWMGDGNDSIDITIDVANVASGHYGYGNHVTLDAGDDTYSVSVNVQDGSSYNLLTGYWNGGSGNDTMSFATSGDASNDLYDGFGGRILGEAGNDTFIFNVEKFTTNVWGYGSNLIDGGADYDTLILEMGSQSDYTLTDTGGGSYDLVYDGVNVDLVGIEEIQFSDGTVFL